MSIYSNVTEQDLINLRKLAEQQKNQRAEKVKNRILKHTHDVKLAESLSPITKKLDEINTSIQKVGDIVKESNSNIDLKSLPKSSKFSNSMRQMLGSLMNSRNFLKITQDGLGHANVLGVPFQISGAELPKINENIYELTPGIFQASTYPTYDGETKKNESDILMMYNIIRYLGCTGIGDRDSKRNIFFTQKLPKLVEEIQNKTIEEFTLDSDSGLQGEGVKFIILSNNCYLHWT